MKLKTVAFEINVKENLGDRVIQYPDYTKDEVRENMPDAMASEYAVYAYITGLAHRDFESVKVVRQLTVEEIAKIFDN